ncbi:response regulator [Candidatus Sulfurimonas marisnigri]|uniref:histidine kinase n=1 Tax=Candidatus Sulfurimonas marisnigri TaxID=2740405 RepID=A0A7S7M1D5_9BACT|nr:response regulator [Candidatus Sulfurimonas marisnigri]QOY55267.1 response regulator [Candidatus Sulfurimonas marisnigri]
MFKKITLKTKIVSITLIGLIVLATIGSTLSVIDSKRTMMEHEYHSLTSINKTKNAQIKKFLNEKIGHINVLAKASNTRDLVTDLIYVHNQLKAKGNEPYPATHPVAIQNVKPHEEFFQNFTKEYDYYDLLIVCAKHGHVMYSAEKESDLGENLKTGNLKNSALTEVWKKVIALQRAVYVDMKPYAPSDNSQIMFLGAPIYTNGTLTSVLVFKISDKSISKIMQFKQGYGDTQEDYLIGQDKLIRSSSSSAPLLNTFNTQAVTEALEGKQDTKLVKTNNGNSVLSAYSPLKIGQDLDWAILSEIDEEEILSSSNELKKDLIIISVILLIIIAATEYWVLLKGVLLPLNKFQEQQEELKEANSSMKKQKEQLVELTESLENRVKTEVEQNREKDLLLANELNRTIKSNEKQVWIKDGLSTLNEKLTGDISVADVSKIAIEHLGNYLHAGVGVLYSYNHDYKILTMKATYAYVQTDDSRNTLKLGEGTIGQVALQMSPILLKDVKVSQLSINTATISQSPLNIYTFPLMYQDKLYGVVEIGSNELFTDKEIEFFNASNRVITTALSTATQNQKVKNLLEETQFVNIQMQEQQQKLEEANANMEEQQQQLEEANAQMEEQHQQLEVQNDSLLKSQNELEKKARDLTASTKYKSEFLANMSHELRTPLNSIILLSDMLQENNSNHLDENEVKKAHVINSSGNDLLKLIGDVLDLSKIEAGMMELIIDEFQSTELCDGFQVQFEEIAKQKNLTFKTVDDYKGLIKNDRDRLGQVLRNLISNSLKFTKSGSITLHVENAADNKIKISVCDTGIGIPKSKQESIFEAFQQADGGTSREYGGTGLGLSISLELIRMMHGEILLDSKENEGSAFSIIIPNIDNKESEKPKEKIEQTALHVEINDDRSALQTNDKPFLIIEDDENFANILKEKINSQGEYALISHTGTSGLALARSYNIKGVLLDLGLPDIDGIDLLKEFKTDSSLRKIPVFVISGDHRVKLTKEYGAEGYIQKPVTDSEITSVIQEIKNSDDEIHEFMSRVNIQSTTNAKESVDLTGKKVLVVDDDIRNIYVLLEALSSKGADVITANDGQEAIDTLSTNIDVDIILMDVMMPVMDGYEAVKIIKENTKTKDIPVIAVTAKALSEDRQNALDAGYDDYITKPLQMKMLMEIICAWVEK